MNLSQLATALLALTVATSPAKSPDQFATWRAEMRHALYVPDKLPALEPKVWSSFSPMPGVIADRVTYRTADGMLVPAIVYRPEKHKGKLPGIVVVNGHGGDKYSWYAFYSGMMFAQAGAEVVTYDPIGEGERNIDRKSRASSHDKIIPVPAGVNKDDPGQRLAGLMQVDVMQAVSYLDQRPEVDSRRIAIVGYSMGAFVSGIAGALDPRIHAVLLSGGGTFDDEADGGKSYDVGTLPCQAAPWHALKVLGSGFHDRGAILYALNANRGPMLVENGSMDTVMDIPHRTPEWFAAMHDQTAKLLESIGAPTANLFTTHVDPGKSHRTAWVERTGVAWLNDQIQFTNWTAAQIAAMPTTHIADWITKNNMPWSISNGYMREDREGGLDALGTNIPGIERNQLSVLPDAEWQRLKPELIYDNWAEKVKAAELAMVHPTSSADTSSVVDPSQEGHRREKPADQAELDGIAVRGRAIAAYDQAAWQATDLVQSTHPREGSVKMYLGWQTDKGWDIGFGKLNETGTRFLLAYEVPPFVGGVKPTVVVHDPAVEDEGFWLKEATALTTVKAQMNVARPYNIAALPAWLEGQGHWWIYVYPAQTLAGTYPAGGDTRYTVSADGKSIEDIHRMHASIIEYDLSNKLKDLQIYRSSYLDDAPEDTDVANVIMMGHVPVTIATPKFVYRIAADGTPSYVTTIDVFRKTQMKPN